MCITSGEARLNNTYVGAWDIEHPDYGYRHVLAYQNRVTNLEEGANCMLLHIPSAQPIEPDWVLDTSEDIDFLKNLYEFLSPQPLSRGFTRSSEPNYVVERGVYHIAILNDLTETALEKTLQQIPAHKLPKIDWRLMEFFKTTYPNFPLLLCCFNNKDTKEASPILVHFPPLYPDELMLNTIDSHGGIPNTKRSLNFHQRLIVGSCKKPAELAVPYRMLPQNFTNSLDAFLPDYAVAIELDKGSEFPNQDICIGLETIHEGQGFTNVLLKNITEPETAISSKVFMNFNKTSVIIVND